MIRLNSIEKSKAKAARDFSVNPALIRVRSQRLAEEFKERELLRMLSDSKI